MRLILVRHAHADPSGPNEPDELRPLSTRGREEARVLGEELAAREPRLVLASPLLRARETAAEIAKVAGVELRIDERLAPGADREAVLEAVDGEAGPVVVVGHQPDCSLLAEAFGAGPRDFPPAGHVTIDLP